MPVVKLHAEETVFFLCDIQTRFQDAIYGYQDVIAVSNKMIKIAKVLEIPLVATEQNPRALGSTDPAIDLTALGPLHLGTYHKTLFSMATPEVLASLSGRTVTPQIVLFGIEAHVCILQTALDLLDLGYPVHVLADGVSSCNREEVPIALERIRQAGGLVTTSESAAFQLQRDSNRPNFKAFSAIIKEAKVPTKSAVETLCPLSTGLRTDTKSAL